MGEINSRLEIVASQRPPIEAASAVMADPNHPGWTADKALAMELAGGQSGLIAVIDGFSQGGEPSVQAAEAIQGRLSVINRQILVSPTINQAAKWLRRAIYDQTPQIQELQKTGQNPNIDASVSAGMVCQSLDGRRRFLVIASVGNTRIYRYIDIGQRA
jgi:hypothetical protein